MFETWTVTALEDELRPEEDDLSDSEQEVTGKIRWQWSRFDVIFS